MLELAARVSNWIKGANTCSMDTYEATYKIDHVPNVQLSMTPRDSSLGSFASSFSLARLAATYELLRSSVAIQLFKRWERGSRLWRHRGFNKVLDALGEHWVDVIITRLTHLCHKWDLTMEFRHIQ
jgi:hypothetical protein